VGAAGAAVAVTIARILNDPVPEILLNVQNGVRGCAVWPSRPQRRQSKRWCLADWPTRPVGVAGR
jgi:hypothetical protein